MQEPSLNSWTSLFLLASLQGLVLALIFVFRKRGSKTGNIFLACFLVLFAYNLLEYVGTWSGYAYQLGLMPLFSGGFPYVYGPLLFAACIYYLGVEKEYPKLLAWLFIPACLFVIATALYYYYPLSYRGQNILNTSVYTSYVLPKWMVIYGVIRIVYLLFWMLVTLKVIAKFKKSQHKQWLYILVGGYGGYATLYLGYFILLQTPFFSLLWDYGIAAGMTLSIYTVAAAGYFLPEKKVTNIIYQQKEPSPKKGKRYEHSGLTPLAMQALSTELQAHLLKEEVYTNSELSLRQVSESLNIPQHYISQVLSDEMKTSFALFVNDQRVKAACRLIEKKEYENVPLVHIGYEVGFNNKVSFNRHFKRLMGQTPGEFRKNLKAGLENKEKDYRV